MHLQVQRDLIAIADGAAHKATVQCFARFPAAVGQHQKTAFGAVVPLGSGEVIAVVFVAGRVAQPVALAHIRALLIHIVDQRNLVALFGRQFKAQVFGFTPALQKYATVFHVLLHFRRRLAPGFQPRGKIIQIAGTQHHRESVRNINAGKNIIQHINFS